MFGGTGLTGRQLLSQALERGFAVSALAREPARLSGIQGRLTVVEGDVHDPAAVERVVTGSEAVLSALGHVKGSPADLLSASSASIVAAMKKLGVRRIVVLTNTAVRDATDRPPLNQQVVRGLLKLFNAKLTNDCIPAAQVISDSGLDWTLVRAPVLTNGPRTGKYKVGPLAAGASLRVSRGDVADFMLSCVADGKFVNERPVVSG